MRKPKKREFLLLFWQNATNPELPSDELARRGRGWRAWMKYLNAQGRLVGGHQLKWAGHVLKGPNPAICGDLASADSNEIVTGYIIIAAPDLVHASTIAKGCPSLAHGVVVEVRQLES